MIKSKGLLSITIHTRVKYKDFYPNLLYALFAVVCIATRSIAISPTLMNALTALCGIACFAYTFLYGKKRAAINGATLYSVFFSMLLTLSSLYNANTGLDNILWIWCYLGVALLLYNFKINYKLSLVIYYSFCVYVFFEALYNSIDANDLLSNASRNGLVTFLLFFACVSYVCIWKTKQQLPYLPSLVLLILSIWSMSRGGVASAAILLGLIFIYNFLYVKKGKISSLVKILLLILIISVLLGSFLSDSIDAFSDRLDKEGMETPRIDLWKEYFNGCTKNLGNFFLGSIIDGTMPKLSYYQKNPHNSFIMLHSRLGLLGFVIIISAILRCLFSFAKNKKYAYLILLVVAISRAFTDWVAFTGAYDVIFWYLFFCLSDKELSPQE